MVIKGTRNFKTENLKAIVNVNQFVFILGGFQIN